MCGIVLETCIAETSKASLADNPECIQVYALNTIYNTTML